MYGFERIIRRDISELLPDAKHNPCGAERIVIGERDGAAAEVYHIEINGSARRHLHRLTSEIYYILEGEGQLELDGDAISLRPGVAVYVPKGTWHRAIGKCLKAIVVCVPRGVLRDFYYDEGHPGPRLDDRFAWEVMDHAPVGLVLVRFDGGKYVYFNHVYSRIIGYSLAEACAKDYWDVTPRKYERDESRLLRSLTTSDGRYGPYYKQYINRTRGLVPVCLELMRLDFGDTKYIWSAVEEFGEIPEYCDGADMPIQMSAICEPPEPPQEVRSTKLFDKAPVGLVVADASGKIIEANEVFCKLIGYGRDDVIGLTHKQITPRKYAGYIDQVRSELRERAVSRAYVKQYITRDKGLVPVTIRTSTFEFNGERFLITAMDALAKTIIADDIIDGDADAPFPKDHPRGS